MEYFRPTVPRSMPIYRRICLRAYLRRSHRFDVRQRIHTRGPVGVCVSMCSPVNEKGCRPRGGWRPGVEAITVTKLPSDCRRGSGCLSSRVCRFRSLSLPPSPSLFSSLSVFIAPLPSSLARILFLARFVRIHDLNSIAFYLLFRAPSR